MTASEVVEFNLEVERRVTEFGLQLNPPLLSYNSGMSSIEFDVEDERWIITGGSNPAPVPPEIASESLRGRSPVFEPQVPVIALPLEYSAAVGRLLSPVTTLEKVCAAVLMNDTTALAALKDGLESGELSLTGE